MVFSRWTGGLGKFLPRALLAACLVFAFACEVPCEASNTMRWNSPNRYRTHLTIEPGAKTRSNSVATVDINFAQILAAEGSPGRFDQHTVEVIGYDSSGQPMVFDSALGSDQYLVPHRVEPYFGIDKVTLRRTLPSTAQD